MKIFKKISKLFLVGLFVFGFSGSLWGNDNEVSNLKRDLLSRYSMNDTEEEILQYMNMNNKFTENGILVNINNQEVSVEFDNSLNMNFTKRFKYYFFKHYVQKFLQYDYEMYNEIIQNRNEMQEIIRKKSQKILDVSTGFIAVTSIVKTSVKDIGHLNYVKGSIKRGGSTDLYISQLTYLGEKKATEIVRSEIEDGIAGTFSDGPMGRVMSQCIFVADMSAFAGCGLETSGQFILNIGDLYAGAKDILDVRKMGAAKVAETYLFIYYLLGEDETKINDFLKNNFGLMESEFNNLGEKLDSIAQYSWNKKYEIGADLQYSESFAIDYIHKYTTLIDNMTLNFMDSFGILILQDGDMGIRFSDMKQNTYAFDRLQVAKAYGIDIKGYIVEDKNYFYPDNNITNAEALALIYRGVTKGDSSGESSTWINREDIKKFYDWFNDGHTAYANLSGINESNLYKEMTRLQMAKLLYFWMKDYDTKNFLSEAQINNIINIGDWTEEPLVLKKLSIIGGKPNGNFEPNSYITRSEFLIMLINSLNHMTCGNKTCEISTILEAN